MIASELETFLGYVESGETPEADVVACGLWPARIVDAVFSKFDPEWVTVWVRKPKPNAGVLDYAGIRITRRRDSDR